MMLAAADLPFQPRSDSAGGVRAFVLAVVIHCLLIAFLYFGVSWQNKEPAPAQADLWTALPPMTSTPPPRVVPPPEPKPEPKPVVEPEPVPPPPVKADIEQKIEKKVEKKVEPKKELPPPPKKEEVKKEPPKKDPVKPAVKPPDDLARELAKEDMQRELNKEITKNDLNRQLAKEGQARAASSNGSSDAWSSKVGALVRSKVPVGIANAVTGNPTAVFEVTVLPGREVGLVRLIKSSGYPAYDEAAQHAIEATSPLPPPTAGMGEIPHTLRFEATPKDK